MAVSENLRWDFCFFVLSGFVCVFFFEQHLTFPECVLGSFLKRAEAAGEHNAVD